MVIKIDAVDGMKMKGKQNGRPVSTPETYVLLKEETERSGVNTYSPVDLERKTVLAGVTIMGAVPEGAKVVGEYESSTGILIPNKLPAFKAMFKGFEATP